MNNDVNSHIGTYMHKMINISIKYKLKLCINRNDIYSKKYKDIFSNKLH